MPTTYRPYDPDQLLLLPSSLKDWLPEGHLAWFVSDAIDALDLKAFHMPATKAMVGVASPTIHR